MIISTLNEVIEDMRKVYPFKDEEADIKVDSDIRKPFHVVTVQARAKNGVDISMTKTVKMEIVIKGE